MVLVFLFVMVCFKGVNREMYTSTFEKFSFACHEKKVRKRKRKEKDRGKEEEKEKEKQEAVPLLQSILQSRHEDEKKLQMERQNDHKIAAFLQTPYLQMHGP